MALFGKSRDVSLFNSVNGELINDIIQTEIAYYKFALEQTNVNVYGEAPGKNYYEPLKISGLINRDDHTWNSDDFGSDMSQTLQVLFLKKELQTINLLPEVGDIFLFRNNFFEIDSRIENQLILGKDPDYAISTGATDFGNSHSIIIRTHLTDSTRLNLVPLKGGKYPSTNKITDGTANLLG